MTSYQPQARTEHERTALARQIEHTDAEIDRLVYELYGLTALTLALSPRARESVLVEGVTK